jgi:mono/diheme cytochrome c family protein
MAADQIKKEDLDAQSKRFSSEAGLGGLAKATAVAALIIAPMIGFSATRTHAAWREQEQARVAAREEALAYERMMAGPAGAIVPVAAASRGRELFSTSCAACHGQAGTGVQGLGRNLTISDFVARESDDALVRFVVEGRPNARPMPMPPKGGHDQLTTDDIGHIVAWLRCLQDARRMPELPAMAIASAEPSEADKAAALAAAGGDAELAGYIASGDKLFHTTCVACHGKGGVGMKGNGAALVNNEFVQSLDDDGLLAFLKNGRSPSDPKNKTGIQMPP